MTKDEILEKLPALQPRLSIDELIDEAARAGYNVELTTAEPPPEPTPDP